MSEEGDNVAGIAQVGGGALAGAAAVGLVSNPVGWTALGVMAAASLYSAGSRKKKKKKLADQKAGQAAELRRRAEANAKLIRSRGEKQSALASVAHAKGNVTGESILQTELGIIQSSENSALKMLEEAEYGAGQIQLQAQNMRDHADDEYRASMVKTLASTASAGYKQKKTNDYGKEKP